MFLLMLAGWILGVVGVFFNWVIIKTVFEFGTYFGTTDSMLAAWGVIRDIANIGLLFGFILMGVMLILNVDGGGHGHGGGISARRAIPRLIIFAVLLNFSLFASQAVIDVANGFASTFASLAGEQCTSTQTAGECANNGIAGKVMQLAGIGTIWDEGIIEGFNTSTVTLAGLTIFVTVTAIVLLAAAIMLIVRVVTLTLLMVTSPIGFAGMVIPGLEKIAKKWWDTLIAQSFFAPVLLLMIFLSLKLADSLNPSRTPLVKAFSEANYSVAGNLEVLVVFAVVIGMMIASLIVSSKIGAIGSSFATNFAYRSVTSPYSFMGRAAIGGGSAAGQKMYEAWSGRVRKGLKNRPVARMALTPILNVSDDAVGGALNKGKNMKFFGGRSFEEERKHREHQNEHLEHAADAAETKAKGEAALKSKDAKLVEETFQKMTTSDIKDILKESKQDLDILARNLSPEKFAELMKDKEVSHDVKHKLSHGRYHGIDNVAAKEGLASDAGFAAAKAEVKNWSPDDMVTYAQTEPAKFENLLTAVGPGGESVFSKDQLESFEKSKSLSNRLRATAKSSSTVKRLDRAVETKNIAMVSAMARNMTSSKDKAKLDTKTLLTNEVIDTLDANDLKEIMSESKLTKDQRKTIIDRLRNSSDPEHVKTLEWLGDDKTDGLIKAYWM